MVIKAYTQYPLELDAETQQAGVNEYINGTTSLDPGLVTGLMGPDGNVYNTFTFLQSGDPVGQGSYHDLKEFFDECGTTGMLIDSGAAGDGINIYFPLYIHGGSFAPGSVHHKTTIGDGILIPDRLRLPHQDTAMLDARIIAVSADGSAVPITYSESAALPATVYPTSNEVFTLGPLDLNSYNVEGIQEINVDFGINVQKVSGGGVIYNALSFIDSIQPIITVRTTNVDVTGEITEAGKSYTASTVTFYAKKRADGGTFVANGTAEHIKFTLGKCRADLGTLDGSAGFTITPVATPGASPINPITVAQASAIT